MTELRTQKLLQAVYKSPKVRHRKTLGELLRLVRTYKGLTQAETAEKMGVCRQQYQKYEYGAITPRLVNRERLASALDIDLSLLCCVASEDKL